ncbi:MAG: hypothetical protein ACT4NY_09150 [Pseudonocardiales bacterium]
MINPEIVAGSVVVPTDSAIDRPLGVVIERTNDTANVIWVDGLQTDTFPADELTVSSYAEKAAHELAKTIVSWRDGWGRLSSAGTVLLGDGERYNATER